MRKYSPEKGLGLGQAQCYYGLQHEKAERAVAQASSERLLDSQDGPALSDIESKFLQFRSSSADGHDRNMAVAVDAKAQSPDRWLHK